MVTDKRTRSGIDAANNAIRQNNADPFAPVRAIIDGHSTARTQRGPNQLDICDAVIPGNSLPSKNNPSLVVTLSPNSSDLGANQASNPNVVSGIGTSYTALLQQNPNRQQFTLQNNGTTNLFLIFGSAATFGVTSNAQYHIKVTPGSTYINELWIGRVDIASDAAGGVVSAFEVWKAQNVSQ